ncbi:hypothetical protein [Bacteroides sp. AF25-38AC]|jgi:hypothetical protein|uniref:hypothetical protein n=1 Tax=Bacteroides sp. AF25-38AC TaxID=2292924 RepID=UPI000E72F990|nr:hypothetical protein [Bacteroides sp. AF25-38AC]RJV34424.1 hypothetical protein DWY55_17025 [Bacteroides sp. AF25-38AC]
MKTEKEKIVSVLGKIDLFIFTPGFERRSTMLGLSLNPQLVSCAYAFQLDENYRVSSEHLSWIKENLNNLEIITYPKNKPFETFELLAEKVDAYLHANYKKSKLHIVIDITAFTREILLILLRIITIPFVSDKADITLVYMPAKCYQKDWLTKGVRDIRPVLGYSGLLSPSKKSLLVILTGFEEERIHTIINAFEPSNILLGHPNEHSSISPDLFKISEQKYIDLKNRFQHLLIDEGFTFSCQDILETKQIILSIFQKYKDEYNIIIAPLNNKISTLGVAFAGLEQEEIQICYASANHYNIENYSEAFDYFYYYKLESLI